MDSSNTSFEVKKWVYTLGVYSVTIGYGRYTKENRFVPVTDEKCEVFSNRNSRMKLLRYSGPDGEIYTSEGYEAFILRNTQNGKLIALQLVDGEETLEMKLLLAYITFKKTVQKEKKKEKKEG